ncbi:AraC family transcriptional regulator [Pelagibacterium sp. 26DY04]|uniref:AraC family transcriptional regulator n=1 Tax=unclassified Pelagibacterium TaxID=2623280 RepID=UPI002815AA97|nr:MULTISPECIES: AraC family transcriptional regulator [unclassified Pelagibacterium]WMT87396.1 AraC family transcriptional regulator [Pelagibacterium sp. 26DY04]WMT91800.1 AraC family transcriptional regulator [Pelagibacterium sp. H642]
MRIRTFGADETHGMVFRPSVEGQITSNALGWTTMFASAQRELPYEGAFPAVRDQLLVWHHDGPAVIQGEGGDKRFCRAVPAGGIHLIPGGADFKINLRNPLSTTHIYLRRSVIEEVAADIARGDPALVEISPHLFDRENMLANLLYPLDRALREGNATTAFGVDYLSLSIAAHLIRLYSNAAIVRSARERSAPVSTTDRAIEFMRAHLHEPIGLTEIAAAVNLSSSQLSRVFKSCLGSPPHRFLINMRVQQAQRLLKSSDLPIAEIALECGFSHQEHLTHQFRRVCRTTPAAYRRDCRS